MARGRRAETHHRRPSPGQRTQSVGLRYILKRRGSPRGRPICTRATDHPSHPQSLCESQHPLQRRRGWVAGPRRIAAQVASIGIGEEMSRSPRPPSDSPWPEGEEQRYTIDGRALVKRRRVLASGIEGEGAPEGDPTPPEPPNTKPSPVTVREPASAPVLRSRSWAYVRGTRRIEP